MLHSPIIRSPGSLSRRSAPLLLCLLLAPQVCCLAGPVAGLLPDDTWTRGNWVGVYGRHSYVLFGADSPKSIFGGPGWPVHIHGYTGDPTDPNRAWLSLMNTVKDDRALLEPKGKKRIAAIWDDHGEVKKLGKGPGLFIDVDVPKGLCLLSLYFFEIDWIQFRHHKLTVLNRNTKETLLTAPVDNYFSGRYKRLVIQGPLPITIRLETGMSPNATISGLFIDNFGKLVTLPAWSARLKSRAGDPAADFSKLTARIRDEANQALQQVQAEGRGERDYVNAECELLAGFDRLEKSDPQLFFKELLREGSKAQQRLNRFIRLASVPDRYEEGLQLAYCWARAFMEPVRQKDYLELLEQAPRVYPPVYRLGAGESDPKLKGAIQKAAVAGASKQAAGQFRRLASSLVKEGKLPQVAQVMQSFQKRLPDQFTGRDHFLYASGLLFMERYTEALGECRQALKSGLPKSLAARANLNSALCLLRLNRPGEAGRLLAAFEKQAPQRAEPWHAYLELARYQKNAGQLEAARHTIEKIMDNYERRDSFLKSVEELILQLNYAKAKPPEPGAFVLDGDRLPFIRFGDLEVNFTTAGAFVITRNGDSVMDGGLTFHERGWKRWGSQIRRTSDADLIQPGSDHRVLKFHSTLKDLGRKEVFALEETVSVVEDGLQFHYRIKAIEAMALEMLGAEFHLPLGELFSHNRSMRFGKRPIGITAKAVKTVVGVFQVNGFSVLEDGADLFTLVFPKPGRWLLLDDRAYQLYDARAQFYAPVPGRAVKKDQEMELSFKLQVSRLKQSLRLPAGGLPLLFDDDGSFSIGQNGALPRIRLAALQPVGKGAGRLLFSRPLLPALASATDHSIFGSEIFYSDPNSSEGIPFRLIIRTAEKKVALTIRVRTSDLQKVSRPGLAVEADAGTVVAPLGTVNGEAPEWKLTRNKGPAMKVELPGGSALIENTDPVLKKKFYFLPLKEAKATSGGLTTDFHLTLSAAPAVKK